VSASLISLVGPPGSGKTTIAGWLAEALGAQLVLEDYAGNPFLADSYAGRGDLRLAGQTWFLLSRVSQLQRSRFQDGRPIVADHAFLQDHVYAAIWLAGEELAAYEYLAGQVTALVQRPAVLIHLDGPVELLIKRIARRGRPHEKYFTEEFLRRLHSDYDSALADAGAPVIRVDIAERDMARPEQRRWLLNELSPKL